MSQAPIQIRVDNAEHISRYAKPKKENANDFFYGYIHDLASGFGSVFRARGTVTWTENCGLQTTLRIEMIRSDVRDGDTLLFGCYRVFSLGLLSGLLCWHWSG